MSWPPPSTLTELSSGFSSGCCHGQSLWRSPAHTVAVSNEKGTSSIVILKQGFCYCLNPISSWTEFFWIEPTGLPLEC